MVSADANVNALPILFVLGPSGCGKSTLAGWASTDLNLLHIEIDRFPDDGIDLERLRNEWDAFWNHADPQRLITELRRRAQAAGFRGAILSFPSGVVPKHAQVAAAKAAGIRFVVLYGSGADCVDAFLKREEASGRKLNSDHWVANNAHSYAVFSLPTFRAYRLEVFRRGRFRTRGELIAEVSARAG